MLRATRAARHGLACAALAACCAPLGIAEATSPRAPEASPLRTTASRADAAASAPSPFELGRMAYEGGDDEGCLREMMLAVLDAPGAPGPREYLRLAAERMVARRRQSMSVERDHLLRDYDGAIRLSREAAFRWNGWLFQGRRAARRERWASAYGSFRRVLDENPLHEDARAGLREAKLAIARALGRGGSINDKERLLYQALLAYDARRLEEAGGLFSRALARSDLRAELEDAEIEDYLHRIHPTPSPRSGEPPSMHEIPATSAPSETAGARPARRPRVLRALPQPGQWAHAQGMALGRAGRLQEAVESLAEALRQAPGNDGYQRDYERLRALLSAELEGRRAESERLYTLGILLYAQGRRVEAIAQWGKAVELDGGNHYAARALQHARQELEEEGR